MVAIKVFPKLFNKEPLDSSFLSLTVTPDRVLACIWAFGASEQVQVLGFGYKRFDNVENLIHHTAVAIDMAGEKAKSDVSKAVFGLSWSMFENDQLSEKAAKLLKSLSEDLELSAQAFVSLAAAINHLLKVEESVTPQAVLVGAFGDFAEVHLIKNNKIVATKTSQSPSGEKIAQLISQLKEEAQELPSRIVVFGIDEKSELYRKLLKTNWQEIFAHQPKIDLVEDEDLGKAVAYAQAQDILGHEPSLITQPVAGDQTPKETAPKPNELGFIEGEDILKIESATPAPSPKVETPPQVAEEMVLPPDQEGYAIEIEEPQVAPHEQKTGKPQKSLFVKIISLITQVPPQKLLLAALIIVILLILAAYVAGQTLVKAQVIIKVNAKVQEANFTAKAISGGQLDLAASQIPAEKVVGRSEGSQKAVATGTKKIGEKAKGEVNVLNWTTSPKKFSAKTIILTKDGLKFTLDSDVEVASRSASTPGQSKITALAVEIGPSGNLSSGNDFTFQEFDELLYSAHNDTGFSGGDEKQITVVAQDDLDKLAKSLTESLTEKAKQDLKNKTADKKIPDEAIVIKVAKKEFDKKLDEEASIINLNMQVEAESLAYDEKDLKNLLVGSIKDLPQNLEVKAENIEIIDLSTSQKGNTLTISGKYRASLVPKFAEDELRAKIAGKSLKEARTIIKEIPQVADILVNFSPNLPLFSSIPRNKSKIQFKIEAS